jgi:hypothetical protein
MTSADSLMMALRRTTGSGGGPSRDHHPRSARDLRSSSEGLPRCRAGARQPSEADISVSNGGGDRLIDLVRQRRRQLPHGDYPADVSKIRLHVAKALFTAPQCFFCLLALGDVRHRSYELEVSRFVIE